LTFHLLRGFSLRCGSSDAEGLAGMAGETDDPDDAAARLEAALERIARHAGSRRSAGDLTAAGSVPGDASIAPGNPPRDPPGGRSGDLSVDLSVDSNDPPPPVEEIAARLDGLIDRLRAALTSSSGGRLG
jgi:hypothetical protein